MNSGFGNKVRKVSEIFKEYLGYFLEISEDFSRRPCLNWDRSVCVVTKFIYLYSPG